MRQLMSDKHPKPDKPYYTVFLIKGTTLKNVSFYALVEKDKNDPSSVEMVYLFNENKAVVGVQVEAEPVIVKPHDSDLVDLSGKTSIFNLQLPPSYPLFPSYEVLIKQLLIANED